MNVPYLLKVKFLLGLCSSKDIFDWAFLQVEQDNINNDLLSMLSLKENDKGGIIEKLTAMADLQVIDKKDVEEYFYPLFIGIFEKSMDIIVVEGLLVQFYNLVKGDICFDESEKISFSIIENDLSLRKSNLPFQIRENDIMDFLGKGLQIN